MLFTHELVGVLLLFSGRVAIGEIVTVEALTGSTVEAVEDGGGERGKRSICTSLEARPAAALAESL